MRIPRKIYRYRYRHRYRYVYMKVPNRSYRAEVYNITKIKNIIKSFNKRLDEAEENMWTLRQGSEPHSMRAEKKVKKLKGLMAQHQGDQHSHFRCLRRGRERERGRKII